MFKISVKMANNSESTQNSGVPCLSPSLLSAFNSLLPDQKSLFNRVYVYLWDVANRKRFINRGGVLLNYWVVDVLRHNSGLPVSWLASLSYFYQITNKGVNTVCSDQFYYSGVLPHMITDSKRTLLTQLLNAGYITRSTRNMEDPHYKRSYRRQPIFIRLSSLGVQTIEGIEKDMYKLLLNSSLDELTGIKKPAKL
jgi:hypothetical protein